MKRLLVVNALTACLLAGYLAATGAAPLAAVAILMTASNIVAAYYVGRGVA